jgi:hypothetical protein
MSKRRLENESKAEIDTKFKTKSLLHTVYICSNNMKPYHWPQERTKISCMILVKNSYISLHTIIQLVVTTRKQGVYCAVANGLLLWIVLGYARCCQALSLRALNQVPDLCKTASDRATNLLL